MNQKIQTKIDQYKKFAKVRAADSAPAQKATPQRMDGLAKVIRSKKEADSFMAELNNVVKKAR
jgi:hypothetical protein